MSEGIEDFSTRIDSHFLFKSYPKFRNRRNFRWIVHAIRIFRDYLREKKIDGVVSSRDIEIDILKLV